MMKKLLTSLFLSIVLVFSVAAGCNAEKEPGKDTYDRNAGLDPNAESAFFDDFKDAEYSNEIWNVGNSKWGPSFNHGVRPENVLWNKDSGIVTIKSYGKYYSDKNKNYQGGTIATKGAYGPGRIETRMKMVPRFGPCTAMWTFMYGDSLDLSGEQQTGLNQEIDIELNVGNDFRNVWFTNWHTEQDRASKKCSTDFYNADGEWHLYTIEWHTDPMRIDYYIDDVLYATIENYIPYVAGTIIVGNWFPDGWAGNADFEEDYMQIDYVRYTPYKAQPYVPYDGDGVRDSFPQVSTDLPGVANMVFNAGFENSYTENNKTSYGWSLEDGVTIEDGAGRNGGRGMVVQKDKVGIELVPDLLEGFEYTLKAWVKLSDASAAGDVRVFFLKSHTAYVGSPKELAVTSETTGYRDGEFFEVELKFTVPEESSRVELVFGSAEGELYVDDVFMNMTKKLA